MTRTTSPGGRAALMAREGCRLEAYRDSVGVPTIGVGHTGRASPPAVAMGLCITQAEADAIFARDLAPFEAAVNRAVTAELTKNQFDACVSLAFNIGAAGFAGSTVVHKLNAGDPAAAADAFLMWVHPPELRQRRNGERAQFLRRDAVPLPALPVAVAAPVIPPIAGPAEASRTCFAGPGPKPPPPHLLPRPAAPGFWARLVAALTRKAA